MLIKEFVQCIMAYRNEVPAPATAASRGSSSTARFGQCLEVWPHYIEAVLDDFESTQMPFTAGMLNVMLGESIRIRTGKPQKH